MAARRRRLLLGSLLLGPLALPACGRERSSESGAAQRAHVDSVVASGGRVDSALPAGEPLRRFREAAGPDPDTLAHAAPSPDALVRQWAAAVSRSDTTALRQLLLDRREFAWLVYPGLRLSQPPYEMPPGLLWSQLIANSDDGLRAVLRRAGGATLRLRALHCPTPPDTQGRAIVLAGCLVRVAVGADTLPEGRWFGSIVQVGGRHKFVGYGNDL